MPKIRDTHLTITEKSIDLTDIFYELIDYKELLWVFVKRDIQLIYKQTILGPLWFVFQPIASSLIYIFLFHKVGKISTGGIPPALFFLLGTIAWTFFYENTTKISSILKNNVHLFSKVYFPRLIVCFSINVSSLVKLSIQFLLIIAYLLFVVQLNLNEFFFTLSVVMLTCLYLLIVSNALGLLITSITYKYKDLDFMFNYFLQLLMFITPVFYRTSSLSETYLYFFKYNPLVVGFEFMHESIETGAFQNYHQLLWAFTGAIIFSSISAVMFLKAERNFVDTI